jgi:hypothetical protein
LTFIAFLTMACAKFVPLPSHTNLVRWQSLPASVGELELVFMKMQPYFCATCEIALATPECSAPTRKATSLRVIMRSATREPVAGVVSVSMWMASMRRPSTPPLSLNSLMAMAAPRRSSPPEAAYWPDESIVRPITSGLACAACAHTRLCAQGPKNGETPARARPEALSSCGVWGCDGAGRLAVSLGSGSCLSPVVIEMTGSSPRWWMCRYRRLSAARC